LKQLQDVETQLALERTRFKDDYPIVQGLKAKRDKLKSLLGEQARQVLGNSFGAPSMYDKRSFQDTLVAGASTTTGQAPQQSANARLGEVRVSLADALIKAEIGYRVQTARIAGLREASRRLAAKFHLVPAIARQYQDLSRNEAIASSSLSRLLQREQELEIQASQELPPWRLVEPPAFPKDPTWPKPVLVLGGGVLLGAFLGLAAASLLNTLDDRLDTIEQVKNLTDLPVVGTFSLSKEAGEEAHTNDGDNGRSSSYGSRRLALRRARRDGELYALLSNLRLMGAACEQGAKVLVVSSAIASEGKTTIAAHLALLVGGLGRRVLLIDGDMNQGSGMATRLELSNNSGLADVLCGGVKWNASLQNCGDGVQVLTGGTVALDPLSLLDSDRFGELVDIWRREYDLVVIDSPSLLKRADAALLARWADALLLVVGLKKVRRQEFQAALECLSRAGLSPLGLILCGPQRWKERKRKQSAGVVTNNGGMVFKKDAEKGEMSIQKFRGLK
jgi:capsular exopolysaccharide synthesis family protein